MNVRKMTENKQFSDENLIYTEFKNNRKIRYKIVPENVVRHVILAGEETQPLLSYLPSGRNYNSYDPAPPSDGVYAYERPNLMATQQNRRDDSVLGAFLRSLMPNYNPANGNDLQQSVQGVLRAMRDLLADIQIAAPDRENGEEANNDNNDNWDDDNQLD
uniref:Uncharacterized protein n=1 Tax=Romanomermis culicivorax TaxID=13658 RepID=A0A915HFQ7_ROMCU